MKPQISPEVDRLMWLVAEEGNPKAIEDFDQRFPNLRPELAKRLQMVRSLRGAKDNAHRTPRIPEFRPRVAQPAPRQRLMWVAAGIAAATIGLASFSIYQNSHQVSLPSPQVIDTAMPTPSAIVYNDHLPTPRPTSEPSPNVPSPTPDPTPLPDYLKPQDFEFSNSKLYDAIRQTAHAGKLTVEIWPGLANIDITQSYPDMTPVEVLKALGAEYGFTPEEEGPGKVVIVPARDGMGPTSLSPTSSPNEPTPSYTPADQPRTLRN